MLKFQIQSTEYSRRGLVERDQLLSIFPVVSTEEYRISCNLMEDSISYTSSREAHREAGAEEVRKHFLEGLQVIYIDVIIIHLETIV